MNYTTTDAENIFKVAPQTVRNWAREFARYLSVSANPQEGKTRIFSEDDMRVLELVARMKRENKHHDEIHVTLMAGERGNLPSFSPDEVRALVSGEVERKLHLEIQVLRRQLDAAEQKAQDAERYHSENIKLKAQLEAAEKRAQDLLEQLKSANEAQQLSILESLKRVEDLAKQIGDAYVKGVMETLNRKGDLPDKK